MTPPRDSGGSRYSWRSQQGSSQRFRRLKWYRKAAEQGFVEAQTRLGILYFTGQGAPKDYVHAHTWFHLAAARYSAPEKSIRKRTEKFRDIAASKMTPAQIVEAERLAQEWKPKTGN